MKEEDNTRPALEMRFAFIQKQVLIYFTPTTEIEDEAKALFDQYCLSGKFLPFFGFFVCTIIHGEEEMRAKQKGSPMKPDTHTHDVLVVISRERK